MIERAANARLWRLALPSAAVAILAIAVGAEFLVTPEPSAVAMKQTTNEQRVFTGTPVAGMVERDVPEKRDPADGDPLDGDPLDGPAPDDDPYAPSDRAPLEIERSGRPTTEPPTFSAYDEDPETVWTPDPDATETWLWLDLGEEQLVREVRVLAQGSGVVAVSVSSDLRRWSAVDQIAVGETWEGVNLRDDGRYVRLGLQAKDGDLPAIAEVAIFGSERGGDSAEQEASAKDRERQRDRNARGSGDVQTRQRANNDNASRRENGNRRNENRSEGQVRISAQSGDSRCTGDRECCEARQGITSVEEDCGRGGSCAIDVRAGGGSALCDGSGGERNRAGGGEGRRAGDGGRCGAGANGGAVTVGDVG